MKNIIMSLLPQHIKVDQRMELKKAMLMVQVFEMHFKILNHQPLKPFRIYPLVILLLFSHSNAQFHDEVLMELCNAKYDYIPRQEKMDLVEEILMENETQFMESQLTVPQFVKTLLQRFELAQSRRKRNEYLALKRGLSSRETYSRIIRQKKDSKSNSSLNQ